MATMTVLGLILVTVGIGGFLVLMGVCVLSVVIGVDWSS